MCIFRLCVYIEFFAFFTFLYYSGGILIKVNSSLCINAIIIGACFMLLNHTQVNAQTSGIEVTGQASVLVEPNQFSLTLSIAQQGRFTDKIRTIVDHKSTQVIDIAKGLGVHANNINSARVSLRIIENDPNVTVRGLEVDRSSAHSQKSKVYLGTNTPETVKRITPDLFELSRSITVNFSEINDYDQFLNAVIKVGVSHISPLTMTVDNTDKYYQQALLQAINNAKNKAVNIANQAGQKIAKLIYVKEMSTNHYGVRYSSTRMVNSSLEHSSEIGTKEINARVLVNYAIE